MAAIAENYQLKWHSFASHLHSCVASYLTNENFADVSLFTLDGHRILAHRFVLSACSQYLHQILKTHTKANPTLPIMIILPPEINHRTLKILIQYMYSGETTVAKDVLENVLKGGDILKIRGLWRPREEELPPKKLVKLHHQKHERHNKENVQQVVKTDDAKLPEKCIEESQAANQNSVIKCATEAKKTPKIPQEEEKTTAEEAHHPTEDEDQMQFLVIKEEPIEWNENEMQLVANDNEMFQTEMTIKPEIFIDNEQSESELYSPLTCELCTETFTIPAEWVRHIQTHTDMLPAKRQRRGKHQTLDDNGTFPPLQCDLCQKYFPTPAEWVHHVQNIHTESELRQSNKKDASPKSAKLSKPTCSQIQHKVCSICNKKFPSHASMLIHKRTHTGERPYMCQYCCKGFNVKSNLLRHLRTLHDKIVNSTDVDFKEDEASCANEDANN